MDKKSLKSYLDNVYKPKYYNYKYKIIIKDNKKLKNSK